MKTVVAALLLTALIVSCNEEQNGQSANGTTAAQIVNGVYFVNLKNGDTVKSPVIVEMGVTGKKVEPAGPVSPNTGHHHLIIDGSYVEKGQMIPKDATHLHFGKGQLVDTLNLSPGEHTLTLQFADGAHMSYGKDWSKTIKITVEK